ncbi:nitrite reductase [Ferrimonas sediminicola]|uniref:Nitrite reductase n=1 Tax=Ferrimonas sediminicola TaxID=2569538 RepID=A0A4U1BDA8_9GAMM|nr:nitrite reductase [Ferrimonas sediminicola]TKB48739.1 nitrite reductase [Ferrimonas sediminicola]
MMTLSLSIFLALTAAAFTLASGHRGYLRSAGEAAAEEGASLPRAGWWAPACMLVFLILISLLAYSRLGHFAGWQQRHTETRVDYLLQSKINQSLMAAQQRPDDAGTWLAVADNQAAAGLYAEAVEALDKALVLQGESAPLLGLKAKYLYYQQGRALGVAAVAAVSRALSLDSTDFTTRELLASHAYRQGQYREAVEHWQVLLDSGAAGPREAAIQRAVERAKARIKAASTPQ